MSVKLVLHFLYSVISIDKLTLPFTLDNIPRITNLCHIQEGKNQDSGFLSSLSPRSFYIYEQSMKFYMKLNFIYKRQRTFKFVIYAIFIYSPFYLQFFLIIVRNWGLNWKRTLKLELNIHWTLRCLFLLMPMEFKLEKIQSKQNETRGSSLD